MNQAKICTWATWISSQMLYWLSYLVPVNEAVWPNLCQIYKQSQVQLDMWVISLYYDLYHRGQAHYNINFSVTIEINVKTSLAPVIYINDKVTHFYAVCMLPSNLY